MVTGRSEVEIGMVVRYKKLSFRSVGLFLLPYFQSL
jgi:hypothetical protein